MIGSRALGALLGVLLLVSPALAQGAGGGGKLPPGYGQGNMPKPEEIKKQVTKVMNASETQTADLEGIAKITYKAIPTSPDEIGKTLGEQYKSQLPKGVDVDAAVKQFGPMIQDAMNTYLTEPEGWKFEALEDLKWKSKKVPKGEYKVSIEIDGEQVVHLNLTQGEAGKKGYVRIPIHFGAEKKQETPFAKLKFELKGITDKKTEKTTSFDLKAEFFRTLSKTKEAFKLEPSKEAKKPAEGAKKDEGEKKPEEPKKPEDPNK